MVISGVPPPMVEALRRVRRCTCGTRRWTCCAGRAGTLRRSEALHRMLPIGRPAAHRAGARPYHRTTASPTESPTNRGVLFLNGARTHLGLAPPLLVQPPVQLEGSADQRQMRKCLREIAQMLARGAQLFCEKAQVIGVTQHLLKQESGSF